MPRTVNAMSLRSREGSLRNDQHHSAGTLRRGRLTASSESAQINYDTAEQQVVFHRSTSKSA